jgi:hypothetical protein
MRTCTVCKMILRRLRQIFPSDIVTRSSFVTAKSTHVQPSYFATVTTKMKLLTFLALIGSTAAFAPAKSSVSLPNDYILD